MFTGVSKFYGDFKKWYTSLNKATLTGAIDVIVIEQPNGTYKSTPFHVRFGKVMILQPSEMKVDMLINDEYITDFEMKLGLSGEAYFEINENKDSIPRRKTSLIKSLNYPIKLQRSNTLVYNSTSPPIKEAGLRIGPYDKLTSSKSLLRCKSDSELFFPKNHDIDGLLEWDWEELPKAPRRKSLSVVSLNVSLDLYSEDGEHIMDLHNDELPISELQTIIKENPNIVPVFSLNVATSDDPNDCMKLNMNAENVQSGLQCVLNANPKATVSLSSCGGLTHKQAPSAERFVDHVISCSKIDSNPKRVFSKSDLVIRWDGRYLTWRAFAATIVALSFDITLPQNKLAQLNINRSKSASRTSAISQNKVNHVKKTIRLSSEELKRLPLIEGVNSIRYTITTKFQGTSRCSCFLYLWKWTDRLVISDIDGTITKSDVLGNIFSLVGPYWAQSGITTLYNRISSNNYRFIYLSSRAIGQTALTRAYLSKLVQNNCPLPDGPILLSPVSVFTAFHKEVVLRKPQEFKIRCLMDISNLFPKNVKPLHAGFGNRSTDVITYKTVNIDNERIFTVNYQGELRHELPNDNSTALSYTKLLQIVDNYFPPIKPAVTQKPRAK